MALLYTVSWKQEQETIGILFLPCVPVNVEDDDDDDDESHKN